MGVARNSSKSTAWKHLTYQGQCYYYELLIVVVVVVFAIVDFGWCKKTAEFRFAACHLNAVAVFDIPSLKEPFEERVKFLQNYFAEHPSQYIQLVQHEKCRGK